MRAVIAAAGRGKRLMPLTADTPKPLLPVQGVRLLDYLLRGLKWAGVTEVTLVVKYLSEMIQNTYSREDFGMKIECVNQSGPDGTGSALLAAEEAVGSDPFMLLWGDVLMDPWSYRRILDAYATRPSSLLSALNWLDDPSTGASVCTDGARITSIQEKPPPGTARSNWNQAGLFVCTREVIAALKECGLSPRGEVEFTSGVQRLIEKGLDVRWMPLSGFWSDVGTPELLDRLNSRQEVAALLR